MHMCTLLAELMELGYEDLANACSPSKTPPMILAAWEGQASAILSMALCKGDPDRQGSNWGEFFTFCANSSSESSSAVSRRAAGMHCCYCCSRVRLLARCAPRHALLYFHAHFKVDWQVFHKADCRGCMRSTSARVAGEPARTV
jgi:hypothetical protein